MASNSPSNFAATATVTPIKTPKGFVFNQHTAWPEPENDLTVALSFFSRRELVTV